MQWISLFAHQQMYCAPKLENRKTSPCSPCAPNLLHVLVSRILAYHNLCSPVKKYHIVMLSIYWKGFFCHIIQTFYEANGRGLFSCSGICGWLARHSQGKSSNQILVFFSPTRRWINVCRKNEKGIVIESFIFFASCIFIVCFRLCKVCDQT